MPNDQQHSDLYQETIAKITADSKDRATKGVPEIVHKIVGEAWPHYGGNHQDADFWYIFVEAIIFAVEAMPEVGAVICKAEIEAHKYELAHARKPNGEYSAWFPYLTVHAPCVGTQSLKDFRTLHAPYAGEPLEYTEADNADYKRASS